MRRRLLGWPALAAVLTLALAAQVQAATMAQLQVQDARVAVVAERIMAANAQLCAQTMPVTGITLHSADQYDDDDAALLFPDGPLALALVLPGSPAERAGLLAGDTVLAIAGQDIAALALRRGEHLREAAFGLLASQSADQPVSLKILRGGQTIAAAIAAPPGCRSLVEVVPGDGLMGRSDGRVIQISYGLAAMLDDDGLATIFAHELGHTVLQHRARLEAAGVKKGLLGELGRNQRLNRQVEVEADLISPHLLANAGYSPSIAAEFWSSERGRQAVGGGTASFNYPATDARGDLIAQEIALYLPLGTGPTWPGHLLALRDQPFAQ